VSDVINAVILLLVLGITNYDVLKKLTKIIFQKVYFYFRAYLLVHAKANGVRKSVLVIDHLVHVGIKLVLVGRKNGKLQIKK